MTCVLPAALACTPLAVNAATTIIDDGSDVIYCIHGNPYGLCLECNSSTDDSDDFDSDDDSDDDSDPAVKDDLELNSGDLSGSDDDDGSSSGTTAEYGQGSGSAGCKNGIKYSYTFGY